LFGTFQEFVDKFRYNAKRASLVQSRIKAIEREVVVEAVEEETHFTFSFPDCGQLGNNVIAIEGATFGYGKDPLFRDVHLGIDQNSRVALVGPNGSGKVRKSFPTLLCTYIPLLALQ
jgi:ATP-binding cassette subfamily F protein 3